MTVMRRLVVFLVLAVAAVASPASTPGAEAPDIVSELEKALAGPSAAEPESAAAPEPERPALPPASSRSVDAPATPHAGGLFPAARVRVTARRHTILASQSAGRVEEVTVRDGDRFAKGQLLVRLDASLLESQIERAEALFRRQELLYETAVELHELQSKGEIEVEVAKMEMEQAKADLGMTKKLLARTRVLAPFPGRVADVFAREMQFVSEGQPPLEILDDSTLELEFIVPSKWVGWFTPGFAFDIAIEENGKTYAARLERIGGKVDPLSQSMKAYAAFVAPTPDLMEGMSGEAKISPPPGVER